MLWLSTQMLKEQVGLEHDRPAGWEAPEKAQVSTWLLPDTGGGTCSLTQTANLKNKKEAMREEQPVTIKNKPGPGGQRRQAMEAVSHLEELGSHLGRARCAQLGLEVL